MDKGERNKRHSERQHLKNVLCLNHTVFRPWDEEHFYGIVVTNVSGAAYKHTRHTTTTAEADTHTHPRGLLEADRIAYASGAEKYKTAGF